MTAPTPDLNGFLAVYEQDDNEWWRLGSGDHQNLFEDAVDRYKAALDVIQLLSLGYKPDGDLWISDRGKFGTHEIVDEVTPEQRAVLTDAEQRNEVPS